jgi:hypothetical protein
MQVVEDKKISKLKKENEILKQKMESLTTQNQEMKEEITFLQKQNLQLKIFETVQLIEKKNSKAAPPADPHLRKEDWVYKT